MDPKQRQSTNLNRHLATDLEFRRSSEQLLRSSSDLQDVSAQNLGVVANEPLQDKSSSADALLADIEAADFASQRIQGSRLDEYRNHQNHTPHYDRDNGEYDDEHSDENHSAVGSQSQLLLGVSNAGNETAEVNGWNSYLMADRTPATNTLLITVQVLVKSFNFPNVVKGFVWSFALTNMNFMGVKALEIPAGFVEFSPARVVLCALIS